LDALFCNQITAVFQVKFQVDFGYWFGDDFDHVYGGFPKLCFIDG
jgi:hypothetical protein